MNDAWKASASNAITNLVDLGTNTLTGLAQGAKDKLQGTTSNVTPTQPIYPAQTNDNNLLWLIAAGAVLYLVLKKK